ncbi:hypothetical protein [Maridesulfovibrio sp. FT414]|uniref:hypothetical protein n=1 Tax=Maridesulfovibrio sp. FT414 TaxID=2979469 RepID=UPI003D8046C6
MHKFSAKLFLLVLIVLAGCSSHSSINKIKPVASTSYILQHYGVLSIAGNRIPLRGMLHLNPEQRTARVVMLNDIGLKLLVAEIIAYDTGKFESKLLFASPFLRMIPPFYDESMRCIYKMYFTQHQADSMGTKISTEGIKKIGNREFATHTIISELHGNYTLELFLNSGLQKDS